MTHAPQFWAAKLPVPLTPLFWSLVECGFGGETAYYRALNGSY